MTTTLTTAPAATRRRPRSALDELEAEAIYIMREAVAQADRPVLLFSGGKDSICMLRLAEKAFAPGALPFPLLHIDTGHNLPELLEFRDHRAAELGATLHVASVPDAIASGALREVPGQGRNRLQIPVLLQALEAHGFDLAFGGARRDEEKARAKERVFSVRDAFGRWDPKRQRPELWRLYNARVNPGEQVRVFPLSDWTELDVWGYIRREGLAVPSIYFAHERRVVQRRGQWLPASDLLPLRPGEQAQVRRVRVRTIGDITCTGCIESHADSLDAVIAEVAAARDTERGARADDKVSETSMEDRKRQVLLMHAQPTPPEHRQAAAAEPTRLRFATAGSVDDGKSTLIGRLLYDTRSLFDDQLEALDRASQRLGGSLDLASVTDGLRAEREQGITIDVAYRYFQTPRRRFIMADCPGHAGYTRNMVTATSNADVALVLVDARRGVTEQTRRHAFIAAQLGVPLIVAVNKMDLVGFEQARFDAIAAEVATLEAGVGGTLSAILPISALDGDHVVTPSARCPWYTGPTLLALLEGHPARTDRPVGATRFPVQTVIRRPPDFRGWAGMVVGGPLAVGDEVAVLPSGARTTVTAIHTFDGPLTRAEAGQSVTVCLADALDVGRGDLLAPVDQAPAVRHDLSAILCWMAERPLRPGDRLDVRLATRTVPALVDRFEARFDLDQLAEVPPPAEFPLNALGRIHLRLAEPLAPDAYRDQPDTGGLVLIDPHTHDTVGAALVLP